MTRTPQQDYLRSDRGALESAIREAGSEPKGKVCKCPFHDDEHASAGIVQGEDGAWRLKCHAAGCGFSGDVFDVRARFRKRSVDDELAACRDPSPPRTPPKPSRVFPDIGAIESAVGSWLTHENTHRYANPDTQAVELVVVRARESDGKKTFIQYRPVPGGFSPGAPPQPWPLYNRTFIRAEPAVVVVEGEKCVEELRKVGVAATTSPCGAGKAGCANWQPLAGKAVYLWPDADRIDPKTGKSTGAEHMRQVSEILQRLEPPVRLYHLDPIRLELPDKGDAVDFLARLDPTDDAGAAVWNVLEEAAEPVGGAQELRKLLEDTITGKRRSIDWPFPSLSRLSKSLFPGTITLICGDPSSGKSFLMTDAMIHWHQQGIKVAYYMLEDSQPEYLLRILAQVGAASDLTDDSWVRAHPDIVAVKFGEHENLISELDRRITTCGDKHPTVDDLATWVEQKCSEGCQVIGIDPITYADFSERPWQDDKRFMHRVRWSLKNSGARLIIVTHPRKASAGGKSTGGLDDLAGGTAYPRHSQTVLWVHRKDPPEQLKVNGHGWPCAQEVECDRVIKISKARNGKGTGTSIGFVFDKSSLRFSEQGLIEAEVKKPKTAKAPRTEAVENPF